MEIHLPEKFKSSLVDHIDLIIYLLIVRNLAIDYAGVVDYATVVYL